MAGGTNNGAQRVRNVGSNYTTFRYDGKAIAYLDSVNDSGQDLIVPAVPVQTLGMRHPSEIVAARAVGAGTLVMSIRELWHEEIWEQLSGLTGAHDIVEIFERLAAQQNAVTCTKIITPPDGRRYGKTYHGVVITAIQDSDQIEIGRLSVSKSITAMYTHSTPL